MYIYVSKREGKRWMPLRFNRANKHAYTALPVLLYWQARLQTLMSDREATNVLLTTNRLTEWQYVCERRWRFSITKIPQWGLYPDPRNRYYHTLHSPCTRPMCMKSKIDFKYWGPWSQLWKGITLELPSVSIRYTLLQSRGDCKGPRHWCHLSICAALLWSAHQLSERPLLTIRSLAVTDTAGAPAGIRSPFPADL